MAPGDRIPTDGGAPLGQNPFANLRGDGLPAASEGQRTENSLPRRPVRRSFSEGGSAGAEAGGQGVSKPEGQGSATASAARPSTQNPKPRNQNPAAPPLRNRGRVDIKRTTAGRGGKTVTVVSGCVGIGAPEKEQLAKKIQKACGAGGTVKDGCIEIQGDQRETAARILSEAGFRPVFAGG